MAKCAVCKDIRQLEIGGIMVPCPCVNQELMKAKEASTKSWWKDIIKESFQEVLEEMGEDGEKGGP